MRLPAADAAAAGRADRDRRPELARGAVPEPRQLAEDLVAGGIDVVGELHLGDRAQAVDAHADRRPHDRALGDRGVEYAVLAVLALQPVGHAEDAAEVTDVLTEHDDVGIARHHDVHRGVERLDHVHPGHGSGPLRAHLLALTHETSGHFLEDVLEH